MTSFYNKRYFSEILSVLIILIFSIALQFYQLKTQSMQLGIDWLFHYNRFYDSAMQIKNLDFQPYISIYGFQQSGRIINAIYGPAFAYLNGIFLIILGSWYKYQLFTNFLITFLSASSMYLLFKRFSIRTSISLPLSLMYASLYIVQAWAIKEYFNSWGSFIIPIGIISGIQLLENRKKINIILMTFVISVAVQVHMLTALLLVILFAIFFIIALFIREDRFDMFKRVVISAIFTILLTANVWYPLIDLYSKNNLLRPFVNMDMSVDAVSLQFENLLSAGQTVSFLPMSLLLLFGLQFLLVVFNKIKSTIPRILTIISFILLILSSKIIDWTGLAERVPFVTIIQFPWRLLTPAVCLLMLAFAITWENMLREGSGIKKNLEKIAMPLILILLLIGSTGVYLALARQASDIWSSDRVVQSKNKTVFTTTDPDELRASFDSDAKLDAPFELMMKSTPDYLPLKYASLMDEDDFYSYKEYENVAISNPLLKIVEKKQKNGKLLISFNSDDKEEVLLPFVVYKDTSVKYNGKEVPHKDLNLNNVGAPQFGVNKGKNQFELSYKVPIMYFVALIVTLLSWFTLIILGLKNIKIIAKGK